MNDTNTRMLCSRLRPYRCLDPEKCKFSGSSSIPPYLENYYDYKPQEAVNRNKQEMQACMHANTKLGRHDEKEREERETEGERERVRKR